MIIIRPITKTSDEQIKEAIEDTARKTARYIREEINGSGGSRISQILKTANQGRTTPDQIIRDVMDKERSEKEENERAEQEKIEKEKAKKREEEEEKNKEKKEKDEKEEKEKHVHTDMFCPSCAKGEHKHTLKVTESGKVKCTGDECGLEYSLIPVTADYECKTCHAPHKKPAQLVDDDTCPFCGDNIFVEKNWDKYKKKSKKK